MGKWIFFMSGYCTTTSQISDQGWLRSILVYWIGWNREIVVLKKTRSACFVVEGNRGAMEAACG